MRRFAILIITLLSFISLPGFAETEVGKIVELTGSAIAKQPGKAARTLVIGSIVFIKDTIETAEESILKLLYTDEAQLTLKPETKFYIDDYAYKKGAKNNKSVGELSTGGFRLLSGNIEKAPERNKVNTPNAVIALVGTDVSADFEDDTLYVGCEKGRVSITNDAGSILIGDGLDKYAVVTSFSRRPQIFIPTTTVRPTIRAGGK